MTSALFRPYDDSRDKDAVHRIWREVGWLTDEITEVMDARIRCGRAKVARIDGEAECLVLTIPGTIRYLDSDLPLACAAAVTTSRIARKQKLAARLTAQAIAADVADGAIVSALGMFEQGYYDRLGFGTGGYVNWYGFDPADLRVPGATRVPGRLEPEDFQLVHANRLSRRRGHGSCNLTPAGFTHADMLASRQKGRFGLGFCDGPGGRLSHHLWMRVGGDVGQGPYEVAWMAFKTREQFLELMGLIRNLSYQVRVVFVRESHGIQLQDLVSKPFRRRRQDPTLREWGDCAGVAAYWQVRICDVRRCLDKTVLRGGDEVRFNLVLSDPIDRFLPAGLPWRGVAGEYVVTLGGSSGAQPGSDDAIPILTASVNAFSRMWLGVRPATALNFTDDLSGPPELLEALDSLLRLPDPQPDWDF